MTCATCGAVLTPENAPPDGWHYEDGRTACTACTARDLRRSVTPASRQLLWAQIAAALFLGFAVSVSVYSLTEGWSFWVRTPVSAMLTLLVYHGIRLSVTWYCART